MVIAREGRRLDYMVLASSENKVPRGVECNLLYVREMIIYINQFYLTYQIYCGKKSDQSVTTDKVYYSFYKTIFELYMSNISLFP